MALALDQPVGRPQVVPDDVPAPVLQRPASITLLGLIVLPSPLESAELRPALAITPPRTAADVDLP